MSETKFKQTEHKHLGEIAEVRRGVRVVRRQLGNGEYPVYQNSLEPLGYYDKFNCPADTPFVICAGAAGEIGYSKVNFWAADDCYYFVCSDKLNSTYLYYCLLSQRSVIGNQVRKASIPRLSQSIVSNLFIPLLALKEQERIASTLSSVDELIASLDKQIAKTRDIKQGVMQQLLNRKTGAEYLPLGKVARVKRGVRVVRSQLGNGEYPVYQNSLEPLGYYDKFNCPAGTPFVIAGGAAGEIGYSKTNFWAADDCYYFACTDKLNNTYLYYCLLSQKSVIGNQVRKASIPRLPQSVVSNLFIPLSAPEEQKRIAGVLTSLDDTIEDLEAKRQKYESVKVGMMQKLLSGTACRVNS